MNRQCSSADSTMACDVVLREAGLHLGVDAAAVDADADGEVVLPRDVHEEADLLAHRLLPLVVPEVAGVVADLVDVGGDGLGQAVALLEVDHEVGLRLPADLGEGLHVLRAVDGHADEGAARRVRMASACSTVASTSWVRVAHMLWTATGWPAPRRTEPTRTLRVGFLFISALDRSRAPSPAPRGRGRRAHRAPEGGEAEGERPPPAHSAIHGLPARRRWAGRGSRARGRPTRARRGARPSTRMKRTARTMKATPP